MRPTLLAIAALAAAAPQSAFAQQLGTQGFGADVDETAGGGLEEASALYFAPPPTEQAEPVLATDRLLDAGTVQLAIALGQVEEGLTACQALRREMQALIGDTYGSYSVNPGWLRRYQSCVVTRAEEVRAVGKAINARQTELISRIGASEAVDAPEGGGDAMRAADLMARLSARQSAVKLAITREGRRQRAFVRYYNTGEFPDALREVTARPQVRVPAGERPLEGPAPTPIAAPVPAAPPAFDDARFETTPVGSLPPEPVSIEEQIPDDSFPTPDFTPPEAASGAPVPLHNPDAEPVPAEGTRQ